MEDSHSEDTLLQKKLELLRKVEYIATYITKSSAVSSDVSKPLEHAYLRITGQLSKRFGGLLVPKDVKVFLEEEKK